MHLNAEESTKAVIARHLGLRREQIKLSHHFRADYGCDNLALIGMALDLEDLEHTQFPFPILEHVDTVADLVDVVDELLQRRDAGRAGRAARQPRALSASNESAAPAELPQLG